jgi:dUTP pyrophosphatase
METTNLDPFTTVYAHPLMTRQTSYHRPKTCQLVNEEAPCFWGEISCFPNYSRQEDGRGITQNNSSRIVEPVHDSINPLRPQSAGAMLHRSGETVMLEYQKLPDFSPCGVPRQHFYSVQYSRMNLSNQLLKVTIKRVDTELPLPEYATPGSVGFDLICRTTTVVEACQLARIPGNVIVQTPPGYMLMLTMRSSAAQRKGLLIPNGVGIIDQDYCGDGDELQVSVYNFRDEAVTVIRGERIAQGLFVPIAQVIWQEVDQVGKGRGGFGSTGV